MRNKNTKSANKQFIVRRSTGGTGLDNVESGPVARIAENVMSNRSGPSGVVATSPPPRQNPRTSVGRGCRVDWRLTEEFRRRHATDV